VPLQKSEIPIEPLNLRPIEAPVDYELSLSSWLPSNLNLPADLGGVTNFSQTNVPEVSLNRYSELSPAGQGSWEWVVGFSYAQLARSGNVTAGASADSVTENLNLTSLRAGVAYRYDGLFHGQLQPLARLALLPTWMTAPSSAIDQNGLSGVGVPVEAAVELIWSPEWWPNHQPQQGGGLALGAHATAGRVGAADLSGAGGDAVLRVSF
jgi:hypothetical protein